MLVRDQLASVPRHLLWVRLPKPKVPVTAQLLEMLLQPRIALGTWAKLLPASAL